MQIPSSLANFINFHDAMARSGAHSITGVIHKDTGVLSYHFIVAVY